MGMKKIFEEGKKEFKRRSAFRKENKNLKQKQKVYSQQLTELGKKAWESKLDMKSYGNLDNLLSGTQKQQDELKTQLAELEKQKQETEDKRKEKNESYESRQKEVAEKKKEVDSRLNEEEKTLKQAQKESEQAKDRLDRIAKEEEQLHKKATAAETPGEEKKQIEEKLAGFAKEKEELDKKVQETDDTIENTTERIKPIEEESSKLQDQIDQIRAEQREVVGELDKSLSEIKNQINDGNKKLTEVTKEQEENFGQLGEKLAGAEITDESVRAEFSDVKTTEKEMAEIKVEIEKLEQEGTPESRSALWKMVGLIGAFLAVVVIVIVVLVLLFGSGDKAKDQTIIPGLTPTTKSIPQDVPSALGKYKKMAELLGKKSEGKSKQPPMTMEEAREKMNTATEEIKKRSQQIQGKEIVVSDKAALIAALPTVSGWQMKEPSYDKGSFGQLETAHLSTVYTSTGPDPQQIDVDITDTATASAILQVTKMFFSMNINREDENGYQKISTYNNIQVIEKYRKQRQRMEITFIVKDRYLVVLRSKGENIQALLKAFMTKFDLSKLQ